MGTNKDKGYKGVGMNGRVAAWYAKNTAKDMAEFCFLADRLAKELHHVRAILNLHIRGVGGQRRHSVRQSAA